MTLSKIVQCIDPESPEQCKLPGKKNQQKTKHVEIFQVNEDLSSPPQHVHIYNALYGASRSH